MIVSLLNAIPTGESRYLIEKRGADEEAILALATTLRFFVQERDGISLWLVEQLQLLEHFWRAQRLGRLGHNKLLISGGTRSLESSGIFPDDEFQRTLGVQFVQVVGSRETGSRAACSHAHRFENFKRYFVVVV